MADTKEKKIRLYKLATEYNLSAESLVEFLKTKGFKVKNHMTQLEDDMITAINAHYKKEIEKAFLPGTPIGRGTEPQDIANAVVFLASDVSADIVGQVICVDGGSTMQ